MIIGLSGKKQSGKDTVAMIIEFITDQYKLHGQILQTFDKFKAYWATQVLLAKDGYQAHWQKKQFAGKLKEIVALLLGCPIEQLEDNSFKEKELGEEWRVWYWTYYKMSNNNSPEGKISAVFYNEEQAKLASSVGYSILKVFPEAVLKSKLLTPRLLLQLLGTDCGRIIIHPNIWVNATMADYKPTNDCQQHSDGLFYTDEHGENEVIPIYPNWIITDVRFPNEVKAVEDKGGIVVRIDRYDLIYTTADNHPSETSLDNHTFDIVITNSGSLDDLVGAVKNVLITTKIIQ